MSTKYSFSFNTKKFVFSFCYFNNTLEIFLHVKSFYCGLTQIMLKLFPIYIFHFLRKNPCRFLGQLLSKICSTKDATFYPTTYRQTHAISNHTKQKTRNTFYKTNIPLAIDVSGIPHHCIHVRHQIGFQYLQKD